MAGEDRPSSHLPSPCSSPASAYTASFSELLKRQVHQFHQATYDACHGKLKEIEGSITGGYNEFIAEQERACLEEQKRCRARFSEAQDSIFQELLGANLPEETVTKIMAEVSSRFPKAPWSVKPVANPDIANVASQTPSTPPPEDDLHDDEPVATASAAEPALTLGVETPSTPSPPKRAQSPDLSTVETPSKRPRTTQAVSQSFELMGTMTRYRQAPADRRNISHQTVMRHEIEGINYVFSYGNKWFVFKCGCRDKVFVRHPLYCAGWGIEAHLEKKGSHQYTPGMSHDELINRYGAEVVDADEAWAKRSNEMLKEKRAKKKIGQSKKRRGKITTPVRRRLERLRATSSETLRAPTAVPEAPMSVSEDIPVEPPAASTSAIVISDVLEDSDDDDLPPISSVGRK